MKKILTLCFLIFSGICLHAQNMSWDLKFLRGREFESQSVAQLIKMKTGEEFLLSITPFRDCFGYIVGYDSARNTFILLNESLKGGNEKYLGPFVLTEPPGTETLFVIMSINEQQKLKDLIKIFNDNPGSIRDSDNLREELAKLQEEASGLGQPGVAFILGGGTPRGSSQEYVTRFSNKEMYVRPIRIQH